MEHPECIDFEYGSRQWNICCGLADLPEGKINKYRKRWGLPPLFEEASEAVDTVQALAQPQLIVHGVSVSPNMEIAAFGPGTELLRIYEKAGIPHCQECLDLAHEMNQWGVEKCRKKIDDIVEDMLPRAKEWISENKPWASRWIPDKIQTKGIEIKLKLDVTAAVDAAAKSLLDATTPRAIPYKGKRRSRAAGCSSCGKGKQKRPQPKVYSAKFKPGVKGSPIPFPFTAKPKTVLLSHMWPVKGNWQWHIDKLAKVEHLYDRKIMGIATDDSTDSADVVKEAFPGWEFITTKNQSNLREVVTYREMVKMVGSDDPNQIVFCHHGKGMQSHAASSTAIKWWTERLYDTVLDNMEEVVQAMSDGATFVGSFRRHGRMLGTRYKWHFSGTYYAFRSARLFPMSDFPFRQYWWGTESWPADHFPVEHSYCVMGDEVGSMYHLNEQPRDEFNKWLHAKRAKRASK